MGEDRVQYIPVTELRFHSKDILDLVAKGIDIVITAHGVPRALLFGFSDEALARRVLERAARDC